MTSTETSDYRLSRPLVARFVGAYLVVFAIVVFAATALVAITRVLPPDTLVVLLAVGLLGLLALAWWLRSRAYVVRLDAEGYDVRLIRGAGVARGRWGEVAEVLTASPRDIPCVVLRRHDARTTTIPVEALETDREQFVRDLQKRLDGHQGLRRL